VDDEALFLKTSSGEYFSLNGTATEIWRQLYEGRSASDISNDLASKYCLPSSAVEDDICELKATLLQNDLIEECDG
jgi:hypothetical protein